MIRDTDFASCAAGRFSAVATRCLTTCTFSEVGCAERRIRKAAARAQREWLAVGGGAPTAGTWPRRIRPFDALRLHFHVNLPCAVAVRPDEDADTTTGTGTWSTGRSMKNMYV